MVLSFLSSVAFYGARDLGDANNEGKPAVSAGWSKECSAGMGRGAHEPGTANQVMANLACPRLQL